MGFTRFLRFEFAGLVAAIKRRLNLAREIRVLEQHASLLREIAYSGRAQVRGSPAKTQAFAAKRDELKRLRYRLEMDEALHTARLEAERDQA